MIDQADLAVVISASGHLHYPVNTDPGPASEVTISSASVTLANTIKTVVSLSWKYLSTRNLSMWVDTAHSNGPEKAKSNHMNPYGLRWLKSQLRPPSLALCERAQGEETAYPPFSGVLRHARRFVDGRSSGPSIQWTHATSYCCLVSGSPLGVTRVAIPTAGTVPRLMPS